MKKFFILTFMVLMTSMTCDAQNSNLSRQLNNGMARYKTSSTDRKTLPSGPIQRPKNTGSQTVRKTITIARPQADGSVKEEKVVIQGRTQSAAERKKQTEAYMRARNANKKMNHINGARTRHGY